MSKYPSSLLHCIRTMAGAYRDDARDDAELLSRYVEINDEAAFATLAVRHGPMIWSICSRVLTNPADVEDAHQVVLLTLANKAAKLRVKDTLAGWLYQVARQTALNARKAAKTRQKLQNGLRALLRSDGSSERNRDEIYEVLHEELGRLAEKLRLPLVLHFLEGRSAPEVARILGVAESAVWKRMARGRLLLQRRLSKHGLPVGAAGLVALLAESASQAGMPPGLAAKAMQTLGAFRDGRLTGGIAELASDVLKHASVAAPLWKKTWLVVFLCISGLGLGAGGIAWKAGLLDVGATKPPLAPTAQTASEAKCEGRQRPRLDLYGDPLPPGALVRLGTTRLRVFGGTTVEYPENFGSVSTLGFTQDGKGLVISDEGCAVQVVHPATGRLLNKFGGAVEAVALSRNRRFLASREKSANNSLSVWNISSGELLNRIPVDPKVAGNAIAISPDAKVVVSVQISDKTILFYEASTGKHLRKIALKPEQSMPIHLLSFSPDGKLLIGADADKLHVWDAVQGRWIRSLGKKEPLRITSFDCSSDGRLAAVSYGLSNTLLAPQRGVVAIWDLETAKETANFIESKTDVTAVAFAPGGKVLATGDSAGDVRLWNVGVRKELWRCKGCFGLARCMVFSPDGNTLAVGAEWKDQTVHLWDVRTGREITPTYKGHRGGVASVAFASKGKEIISTGFDGAYRVWTADTGVEQMESVQVAESSLTAPMTGGVSADGKHIAFAEIHEQSALIKLIHRDGGGRHVIQSVAAPIEYVHHAAFSPNGEILACAGLFPSSGTILLETATGRAVSTIPSAGLNVAFSGDGKKVAAVTLNPLAEFGKGVTVWDVQKQAKINAFMAEEQGKQKRACLPSVCFSPDGDMVATTGTEGRVRLWRLHSIRRKAGLHATCRQQIDFAGSILSKITFSPDGKMIAANDKDHVIHLWETATGKERARFVGHQRAISSLAFSPDGRRLASGSRDTTILIWDVTGRLEGGVLRAVALSDQITASLWAQLADADAASAAGAIWTLVSAGAPAVSLLEKRLFAASANDAEGVSRLIAKLDDSSFVVRRRAQDKLRKLGPLAEEHLHQALQENLSEEQLAAVQRLLEGIEGAAGAVPTGEELRTLRGIEVLEQIGDPKARVVLERLAAGSLPSGRTQAARAALKRLKQGNGG